MDESDTFFTLTIVGSPTSLMLGRRSTPAQMRAQGLNVRLDNGLVRLTEAWRELAILRHGSAPDGLPHRCAGRLQRWMERHALRIALCGLVCLGASVVTLGVVLWR